MKSLTVPKILPLEYPPPIPAPHTRTGTSVNRPVRMVANTVVGPPQRMDFAYDHQGRRITKRVWNNTAGTGTSGLDQKVPYDGWNLVAVLGADNTLLRSFAWETDFSGTPKGAGGVGGLLWIHDISTLNNQPSTHFVAHDGNGNVSLLVNATDGTETARYEYGPFGEVIRATGPMAKANPFRFSTKYQDDETDLLYYGYRYYNASTGRWISRDPIEEQGGVNLFGFVGNNAVCNWDLYGLWWLDPSHAGLTESAWEELGLGARYPDCPSILKQLVTANEATDKAPYSDLEHLAYHYNRKVGEDPNTAKRAYILVRIGLRLQLLAFQIGEGNATPEECSKYIENYGRLLHSSQDYYGHAVANAAVDNNSDVGVLRGNPDNLSPDFKPSSYAGLVGKDEHGFPPRDGEPGTRNGQQAIRTRQTNAFTKKDMTQYLDAYYAKCKCNCKK